MARSEQQRAVQGGVPVPPPDPRPYVPSIILPGNRDTAFLALHDSVLGFLMHWVGNQDLPHVRDREWCAGCKLGQTPRWTGFLGVISLNTMNRFVLKVPAAAFRCSGHFRDRSDAGTLAGTVFTGYRFGKANSKTNPAVIELIDQTVPMPRSYPFPLKAALSRLWNMDTLDAVDEAKRPEDMHAKLAAEFISFAEVRRQQAAKGKGVQP